MLASTLFSDLADWSKFLSIDLETAGINTQRIDYVDQVIVPINALCDLALDGC